MFLRRNVLIFHAGALGDFVLSWPLGLALARIHPESRIIYVTHAQKGALAERVLRVESSDLESGGWHHLFVDGASKLRPPARKLLEGAHGIYSFITGDGDGWSEAVRSAAPGADLCCLRPRPPEGAAIHSVEHLLAQLEPRKAVHEAVRQMLRLVTDRGLVARQPVRGRIAVHPGSGSAAKCWPAEHFLDLCRRFRAEGRDVRLLLGEVEMERWPAAVRDAFDGVAEVRRPATYLELADELLKSEMFVGNDSGPAHLAAVLGVPTFTLFGPTDPAVWRPVGPHADVLRSVPLNELDPKRVYDWIVRERQR
jgi:ADP-heptose:LPS heptosyltransferase